MIHPEVNHAQPDAASLRYTAPEDPSSAPSGKAAAAKIQAEAEGMAM